MLLPKFDYHEPVTLDEACQIMAELGEDARPLAGGTDLIVNMKKKVLSPKHLVSLGRIGDLRNIDSANGVLKIGASVSVAQISESDEIKDSFSALHEGALNLGSPLIRNLATIAGNIVSARPAADLPPPLMVHGAKVVLKSTSGERAVALENFFKGPGQTVIAANEILKEVVVLKPEPHSGGAYIKLGIRKALEISLVNVAAFVCLDSADGPIKSARIVIGSVAPTPLISPAAEKVLVGEIPSEALFVRAGEAAALDSRPIDDFRASAQYKRAMVEVLTKRALNMAMSKSRGND